jgi:hypothetical protein
MYIKLEHGRHSKRCGHLNHDDIRISELQARAKYLVTTSTNAIGRCAIKSLFSRVLITCASIVALQEGKCVYSKSIKVDRIQMPLWEIT